MRNKPLLVTPAFALLVPLLVTPALAPVLACDTCPCYARALAHGTCFCSAFALACDTCPCFASVAWTSCLPQGFRFQAHGCSDMSLSQTCARHCSNCSLSQAATSNVANIYKKTSAINCHVAVAKKEEEKVSQPNRLGALREGSRTSSCCGTSAGFNKCHIAVLHSLAAAQTVAAGGLFIRDTPPRHTAESVRTSYPLASLCS
eukprot:scaffold94945_cov18-Tisochrysis_lutea.AAC.5